MLTAEQIYAHLHRFLKTNYHFDGSVQDLKKHTWMGLEIALDDEDVTEIAIHFCDYLNNIPGVSVDCGDEPYHRASSIDEMILGIYGSQSEEDAGT